MHRLAEAPSCSRLSGRHSDDFQSSEDWIAAPSSELSEGGPRRPPGPMQGPKRLKAPASHSATRSRQRALGQVFRL